MKFQVIEVTPNSRREVALFLRRYEAEHYATRRSDAMRGWIYEVENIEEPMTSRVRHLSTFRAGLAVFCLSSEEALGEPEVEEAA